jgi:hypothetical protein
MVLWYGTIETCVLAQIHAIYFISNNHLFHLNLQGCKVAALNCFVESAVSKKLYLIACFTQGRVYMLRKDNGFLK